MKLLFFPIIVSVFVSGSTCHKNKAVTATQCYKGKLAIKGICGNYTIQLLEGHLDASKMEASWTNETTHKQYNNVFALGNPCSFPNTINEGQTFYFTIGSQPQNCMVCMAYYPKPFKALNIQVVDNCNK